MALFEGKEFKIKFFSNTFKFSTLSLQIVETVYLNILEQYKLCEIYKQNKTLALLAVNDAFGYSCRILNMSGNKS